MYIYSIHVCVCIPIHRRKSGPQGGGPRGTDIPYLRVTITVNLSYYEISLFFLIISIHYAWVGDIVLECGHTAHRVKMHYFPPNFFFIEQIN